MGGRAPSSAYGWFRRVAVFLQPQKGGTYQPKRVPFTNLYCL